jgi:hypothetical protein
MLITNTTAIHNIPLAKFLSLAKELDLPLHYPQNQIYPDAIWLTFPNEKALVEVNFFLAKEDIPECMEGKVKK